MASALRCLARTVLARKSVETVVAPCVVNAQVQTRNYKISTSPLVTEIDLSKLPDFEISKDPKEWEYVESLIPIKIIPQPKKVEGPTPSGWVPPTEKGKTHPYFVPRTKNHMQPVYLQIEERGQRRLTVIKKIQGDIWQLEKELKQFLESKLTTKYKHIPSRVNELCCYIKFKGDHVAYTKQWMNMKGF